MAQWLPAGRGCWPALPRLATLLPGDACSSSAAQPNSPARHRHRQTPPPPLSHPLPTTTTTTTTVDLRPTSPADIIIALPTHTLYGVHVHVHVQDLPGRPTVPDAADLVLPISPSLAAQLYDLVVAAPGCDTRVRHYAFAALQMAATRPPSLYRCGAVQVVHGVAYCPAAAAPVSAVQVCGRGGGEGRGPAARRSRPRGGVVRCGARWCRVVGVGGGKSGSGWIQAKEGQGRAQPATQPVFVCCTAVACLTCTRGILQPSTLGQLRLLLCSSAACCTAHCMCTALHCYPPPPARRGSPEEAQDGDAPEVSNVTGVTGAPGHGGHGLPARSAGTLGPAPTHGTAAAAAAALPTKIRLPGFRPRPAAAAGPAAAGAEPAGTASGGTGTGGRQVASHASLVPMSQSPARWEGGLVLGTGAVCGRRTWLVSCWPRLPTCVVLACLWPLRRVMAACGVLHSGTNLLSHANVASAAEPRQRPAHRRRSYCTPPSSACLAPYLPSLLVVLARACLLPLHFATSPVQV